MGKRGFRSAGYHSLLSGRPREAGAETIAQALRSRRMAGSAHNPELKQFAEKTLPTIQQHQKMALDLSRRLSETAAR